GLILEDDFGEPQDVEWAWLSDGRVFILQSRPLQMLNSTQDGTVEIDLDLPRILEGGETARPGIGSGPAYLVFKEEDLADFPDGGILVAPNSSPVFACVLDRAAAVVTDVGGVTGHMASLTREFGVPAIVGAKGATGAIVSGQIITVHASARRVYAGRPVNLVNSDTTKNISQRKNLRGVPPWQQAARLITPLTLTDSKSPKFRPENCLTFHDIIRFIHEKSFSEMFRLGDALGAAASNEAKKLANKLPFAMLLIDLGGGLAEDAGQEVTLEQVISVPGVSFLQGLLDPRIQWDRPRPVSLSGLASVLSRSMFTPTSDGQDRDIGETTFAIMSGEYLNFNSRVGYHFAAVDSVCGPLLNDNYISFRFQGGAATEDRRSLRAELISNILSQLGFEIRQKADVVHAFLKKHNQQTTKDLLAELGRLTIFTRQMDMLCHNRNTCLWLAQAFIDGNYNLETTYEKTSPT
ncbi:MAG: phosphoenolpyruvate synthase, partial [Deltaproteobacteria bacterium]|nr:phosphoenolpyruvate synthase [Deltaproteobacteria bacterium]